MCIYKSVKRISIYIVYYKHEINLIASQSENEGKDIKCLLLIYTKATFLSWEY